MHASAPKFDQPFEIRLQVVTRVQLEPVLPVISGRATPWISAVREEHSLPQGPLAPVRVMLSLSIVALLRPHPPDSEAHGDFGALLLYAMPSLCWSA